MLKTRLMIYEKWQTKCKLMYSITEFFFVLLRAIEYKKQIENFKVQSMESN